ncbi:hypothetical protein BV20DRAFT_715899 [Pilatotrama ljubarskyi]|nr:hypothetical protein BV20DRAFT_715899 [Pilatotrama ljubarskyi]
MPKTSSGGRTQTFLPKSGFGILARHPPYLAACASTLAPMWQDCGAGNVPRFDMVDPWFSFPSASHPARILLYVDDYTYRRLLTPQARSIQRFEAGRLRVRHQSSRHGGAVRTLTTYPPIQSPVPWPLLALSCISLLETNSRTRTSSTMHDRWSREHGFRTMWSLPLVPDQLCIASHDPFSHREA